MRPNQMRSLVPVGLALGLIVSVSTAPPAHGASPPGFLGAWGTSGTGQGQLDEPFALAVSASGTVYVADWGNDRITMYDANGTFLHLWGSKGSAAGQFKDPTGIAVDQDGWVYVTDYGNARIQKFTSGGDFVIQWGVSGWGDGQFQLPYGIAAAPNGHLYVIDTGNARVQEFTSDGTFVRKWGSQGSGADQFSGFAYGIAVGPDGEVFVADSGNCAVKRFTSTGQFVTSWGTCGTGDSQFDGAYGVAIGPDQAVYVVEYYNRRVQQFGYGGAYVTRWGRPGSGNGEFDLPSGVAADAKGRIFIADSGNDRIQKFGRVTRQPDGRVRVGTAGAFVGDNVYNRTGAGQTSTVAARRGTTITFGLSIQNDGTGPDAFNVKGGASAGGYSVRYSKGATDITTAVMAGTFRTARLGAGGAQVITARVTITANAKAGSTLSRLITLTSTGDGTARDAVKIVVRRT
jgi:hypothetical protein